MTKMPGPAVPGCESLCGMWSRAGVSRWTLHLWWMAVLLGTAASGALVVIAAPLVPRQDRLVLGPWLRVVELGHRLPSYLALSCLLVLAATWVGGLRLAARVRRGALCGGVAVWVTPFVLTPPLASRDIYAYLAQGELQRHDLNPYRAAIAALGRHAVAAQATDPLWRHTLTPYGPLGLQVEHLVALGGSGHELRSLVMFRAIAVLALVVTCASVWTVAGQRHVALWCVLSPVVLVHEVAGAHLDALICAATAGAIVLVARARPAAAVALAVVAVNIKASAAPLLLVLILVMQQRHRAVVAAVAAQAVICLSYITDPFGWLRGLTSADDSLSPGTLLVRRMETQFFPTARTTQLEQIATAHVALALLGAVAVALQLLTYRRRDPAATAALLMMTTLLCGPALWAWYLGPIIVLLAVAHVAWARPVLVVLAVGGSFLGVPVSGHGQSVAFLAEIAMILSCLVIAMVDRRRPQPPPSPNGHSLDRVWTNAPTLPAT